jgi:uncharacterized membrane protein
MPSQLEHPITSAVKLAAWFAFFWYTGPFVLDGLIHIFSFNWANADWGDCRVDWGAARLFLQKKSPYSEEGLATMNLQNYGFGHPPTTSFWFIPLAKVGYPVMSEIVAILTLVALLFHFIICARELDLPAKTAFVLLPFGLVLQMTWFRDHLVVVQISEIIAFLFTLSWYFLRRGREIEAGVTLGAACTLKLFPGVLVLFFLVADAPVSRRCRRLRDLPRDRDLHDGRVRPSRVAGLFPSARADCQLLDWPHSQLESARDLRAAFSPDV